jgi:excinuclease UvrABC helicase subunit UvrB
MQNIDVILEQMQAEMELRHKEFTDAGLLVEAERIKKRVSYDIRMIRET